MRRDNRARLQDRLDKPAALAATDQAQVSADVRAAAIDLVAPVASRQFGILEDAPARFGVGRTIEELEPGVRVFRRWSITRWSWSRQAFDQVSGAAIVLVGSDELGLLLLRQLG